MRTIGVLVLAIAFTWLSGCSNALYFYETEKIGMSVEGRPDSSQPVQGSLGLKQRVAVVAPPEDPDTMTSAKSEALSMISSFRFRKDRGTLRDIGPVTIQTAFVTGKAAKCLDHIDAEIAKTQVGEAAKEESKRRDEINNRGQGDDNDRQRLLELGCRRPYPR